MSKCPGQSSNTPKGSRWTTPTRTAAVCWLGTFEKINAASSLSLLSSQTAGWAQPCPKDTSSCWPHHGRQDVAPTPRTHTGGRAAGCLEFQAILNCSGPQSKVTLLSPREKWLRFRHADREACPARKRAASGPKNRPERVARWEPGHEALLLVLFSLILVGTPGLSLVITPQLARPQGLGCP